MFLQFLIIRSEIIFDNGLSYIQEQIPRQGEHPNVKVEETQGEEGVVYDSKLKRIKGDEIGVKYIEIYQE